MNQKTPAIPARPPGIRPALVGLAVLTAVLAAAPAEAVDRVLEISHACAVNTGCFPGDGSGYPVQITESGTYLLTENLDLTAGPDADAISITADHVTIDLNGFEIRGSCDAPPFCKGSGVGIDGAANDVAVRNGTVRGMPASGVILGDDCVVEGVRAIGNNADGLRVDERCLIRGNLASRNGNNGITAFNGSVITRNVAAGNVSAGFSLGGAGILVSQNAAAENGQDGFRGSFLANGNSYVNNAARDNGGDGFEVLSGAQLRHNTSSSNGLSGINVLGGGATLIGNVLYQNGTGLSVRLDTALIKNIASQSTVTDLAGPGLCSAATPASCFLVQCNVIGTARHCP